MRFIVIGLLLLVVGCSEKEDEVLRVGSPMMEGAEIVGATFHTDIDDSERIAEVREMFENLEEIPAPEKLEPKPDVVFSLDRADESINEVHATVWYQDDGGAIALRGDDRYVQLSESQAKKLKEILIKES